MQFESYERETPQINVSALIDVVFILLIFVVLAANFDRIREMNVALPTAEEVDQPTDDALVLTLPVDGPMQLNEEDIDAEELPEQLEMQSSDYDVLVLVGDGDINLDQTVDIFDKASAAGFESVSIATREEAQ